jgi:hypothetical protein
MKIFGVLAFLFLSCQSFAQERLTGIQLAQVSVQNAADSRLMMPNDDFLALPKEVHLISVSSYTGSFQKSYLVNNEGEVLSSGFMHSSHFMPNNNLIVITGEPAIAKDSFNPYGARDMASMLLFGTLNNFITKLRIKGR